MSAEVRAQGDVIVGLNVAENRMVVMIEGEGIATTRAVLNLADGLRLLELVQEAVARMKAKEGMAP